MCTLFYFLPCQFQSDNIQLTNCFFLQLYYSAWLYCHITNMEVSVVLRVFSDVCLCISGCLFAPLSFFHIWDLFQPSTVYCAVLSQNTQASAIFGDSVLIQKNKSFLIFFVVIVSVALFHRSCDVLKAVYRLCGSKTASTSDTIQVNFNSAASRQAECVYFNF